MLRVSVDKWGGPLSRLAKAAAEPAAGGAAIRFVLPRGRGGEFLVVRSGERVFVDVNEASIPAAMGYGPSMEASAESVEWFAERVAALVLISRFLESLSEAELEDLAAGRVEVVD